LNLEQDCDVNQLEGSPGIDLTFCLLGTHDGDTFRNRQRRLGGNNNDRRQLKNDNDKKGERHVKIDFDDKVTLVNKRQLDGGDIEIISIQFLEFDTSGRLIVLNQDDTYADTSLNNGDIVTFKSISRDLDPTLPIEDQLDVLPGGVQVTLRGKVMDKKTGEEKIVSNRITWSYTNGCDVEPLNEGMGIGWTTIGELTPASSAFCSAPTVPTDAPTTPAPITASPTPAPVEICSFCPDGVDDPDFLLPTEDGATCGVAKAFADTLPADDDTCQLTKLAETLCCPPKPDTPSPTPSPTPVPVEMCEFCPDGLDDPDLLLPTEDGATCGTAKDFADTITADNDFCATVKLAEGLCCPPKPETPSPTPEPTEEPTPSPSMPPVPVTTEAPPETTEAPPATTEAPHMSMPDTTIATETPPMSMPDTTIATEAPPIFSSKSKASKACSSADGASKSSKCGSSKSSKSKTKKNPTKTKTHKGFYPMDPMSKVAKEDGETKDSSSKGSKSGVDSSKGGKGAVHLDDSKSGKALVDMDAKAEKLTKTTKSAKSDGSGKSAKKEKGSKSAKSSKSDSSGKAAKKLFHKSHKDAVMSL